IHQPGDAIGPEQTHQVVFEREEELRGAGIALTSRAPAQLAIDAPRLVAFRADDVQATALHDIGQLVLGVLALRWPRLGDAGTELNVGSTSRHVGGDRHRARLSSAGDDLGFALVIVGVEDVVWYCNAVEHARESL